MKIRLDIDTETAERLVEAAVAERRPIAMQAEVLLRRALGLPDERWEPTEAQCAREEGADGRA